MKKLLYFSFLLLLCLSTNSCGNSGNKSETTNDTITSEPAIAMTENEETIIFATNNGGTITFVVDTNVLLMDWQNYLSSLAEIGPCQLNQVEIILHEDNYYMIATGTKGTDVLKSTIPLQTDETNNLFVTGFTITCTTTECASESFGCIPNTTSCTPCANKGACTKSTTHTPKVIFPNL